MNAAETLKQASATAEQRAYEPSMEEILASIRRIIADDQSLPNRASVRDGEAVLRAALDNPEIATAEETASVTRSEPFGPSHAPAPSFGVADAPAVIEEEPVPVEAVQVPRIVSAGAPGHIAAPQYAMPDNPPHLTMALHPHEEAPSAPVHPTRSAEHPTPEVPETRGNLARHEPIAFEGTGPAASLQTAADLQSMNSDGTNARTEQGEAESMSSLFSSATDQTVTAAFNTLAASRLLENDAALKDMVRDMIRPLLKSWLDDNLPNMVERLVRAEIERVGRGGR